MENAAPREDGGGLSHPELRCVVSGVMGWVASNWRSRVRLAIDNPGLGIASYCTAQNQPSVRLARTGHRWVGIKFGAICEVLDEYGGRVRVLYCRVGKMLEGNSGVYERQYSTVQYSYPRDWWVVVELREVG